MNTLNVRPPSSSFSSSTSSFTNLLSMHKLSCVMIVLMLESGGDELSFPPGHTHCSKFVFGGLAAIIWATNVWSWKLTFTISLLVLCMWQYYIQSFSCHVLYYYLVCVLTHFKVGLVCGDDGKIRTGLSLWQSYSLSNATHALSPGTVL